MSKKWAGDADSPAGGLIYRRHFTPAIVGDPNHEDPKKRRAPSLPEAKHGCRFHDLRHTCVAFLIERDVGVLELSRQMGHTKTATTMDLYGHLYEGTEQRVATALDAGWQTATGEVVPCARRT